MDNRTWRKASHSNGQGSCVEVGNGRGHVLVRDTKQAGKRDRTTLAISVGAWRAFLGKIKLASTKTRPPPRTCDPRRRASS